MHSPFAVKSAEGDCPLVFLDVTTAAVDSAAATVPIKYDGGVGGTCKAKGSRNFLEWIRFTIRFLNVMYNNDTDLQVSCNFL